MPEQVLSAARLCAALDDAHSRERQRFLDSKHADRSLLRTFLAQREQRTESSGDAILRKIDWCMEYLEANKHYELSSMQRDAFRAMLKASLRAIYRDDFHRCLPQIQERFKTKELRQEVFLASYRRSGKTTVTTIFSAVLAHCAPGIEISVFSTGARASKKFLIGVIKVLCLLPGAEETIKTSNKETVVLENPDAPGKKSIVNSFPSKVTVEKRTDPPPQLARTAPRISLFFKIRSPPLPPPCVSVLFQPRRRRRPAARRRWPRPDRRWSCAASRACAARRRGATKRPTRT